MAWKSHVQHLRLQHRQQYGYTLCSSHRTRNVLLVGLDERMLLHTSFSHTTPVSLNVAKTLPTPCTMAHKLLRMICFAPTTPYAVGYYRISGKTLKVSLRRDRMLSYNNKMAGCRHFYADFAAVPQRAYCLPHNAKKLHSDLILYRHRYRNISPQGHGSDEMLASLDPLAHPEQRMDPSRRTD